MAKAIQITDEAYNELVAGRELAIQKAEKENDKERVGALKAMGIGGFAGWLIFKGLKELGVETVGDIVFGSREMKLTREERLIWLNLVALASASRNPGVIQPDDKPKLALAFGVPLKLLEQSLAKFIEQGMITDNEHGLTIVSWKKYAHPK